MPLPATSVSSVKAAPVPSAPCQIPAGSSVVVIQPNRINVKCVKASFKSVIYDSSVPNNRDAVSVEIETKGFAFDGEARELMTALNAHPGPFLDIGANLGWFTTMVTACTNRVTYAIEPFAENFNRLLASACENEVLSSRLHAYNIGLDTKSSKCSLYQVPDHNKGDTHSICDEEQKAAFAARNYIELGVMQTAPLDSLYSSGQLGDVPFSLMKIDVEGYELNSILSASAFLSSSIAPQCINIEMDSRRSQEASSWHVDCEAYIGGLRVILRGYGYRHEASDNLNSKLYCSKFDFKTLMFCKHQK
ncbi:hypothetical protein TrRE_jg9155 [Triparma retinervis]|uniref:Methyltransferase FkbM domain-containing protein n=1 Tax=Triparma retinervis TaxID=2557542 RepID=A0A9W7L5P9_9STRA|nr:hypothetical protein TrRE_jg9155 [Triparma retinervis]